MNKTIAGKNIEVNDEGYLLDFSQWDKDIAVEIANDHEIDMTDEHWKVIDFLHEKHHAEEALSIRGIKKSGVLNIKDFYRLFPGGPLKISTKIAGIPKPKSCI